MQPMKERFSQFYYVYADFVMFKISAHKENITSGPTVLQDEIVQKKFHLEMKAWILLVSTGAL